MAPPRPKEKADELIEQVNRCAHSPDPFTIRRLKAEVRKLVGTDPVIANTMLGALAGIEGDVDACHRYHREALDLNPSNANTYANYAASLKNLRLMQAAYEQMQVAYRLEREVMTHLASLVELCCLTGRYNEAIELGDILLKSNQDVAQSMSGEISTAKRLVDGGNLDDGAVSAAFELVANVLNDGGFQISSIDPIDYPEPFFVFRVLGVDAQRATELNAKVAEVLCSVESRDLAGAPFVVAVGVES